MFQVFKNNPLSYAAIAITAIVISGFFVKLKVLDEDKYSPHWYRVINSDGAGYYSYLPAIILYQDLNYNYLDDPKMVERYNDRHADGLQPTPDGDLYNKYYMGTAVLMLPFFLIAIMLSWVFGFPIDGFSEPFQVMAFVATLSYLIIGLLFLSKTLTKLGIKNWISSVVVLAVGLGTNLVTYTFFDPAFSHVYLFFLISYLLYIVVGYVESPNTKSLALIAILVGLIFIARPTSVLCVLALPMLCSTKKELMRAIIYPFQKPLRLMTLLIPTIVFVCFQLILLRIQLESWKIWSYQNEGFNFNDPQLFKFLFGYRKGLFVYSPFFILSLLGGVVMLLKNRVKGIGFFLAFFGITYVLSSWWSWWFGGGFGSRAMIDFYAILAIPMAILIQQVKFKWIQIGIAVSLVFFISTNLIQNYQYWRSIMPFDLMTKEKFWQIYLETSDKYRWATEDPKDLLIAQPHEKLTSYYCNFSNQLDSVFEPNPDANLESENGNLFLRTDQNLPYGAQTKIPFNGMDPTLGRLIIRYKADVKTSNKLPKLTVVVSHNDFWYSYPMMRMIRVQDEWRSVQFDHLLDPGFSQEDTLSIYLYQTGQRINYIDNIEITINQLEEQY